MRASSLSNDKVIELLNHYFVPVYLRNEDCSEDGSASPAEKATRSKSNRSASRVRGRAASARRSSRPPDRRLEPRQVALHRGRRLAGRRLAREPPGLVEESGREVARGQG